MTSRILDYLGRNAIAFTALGCSLLALGGASYAAVSLPNNSVGTAQLRNGAVTPSKVDRGLIGGYVRAWATTNNGCELVGSSGGARLANDHPCSPTGGALIISWPGKFPRRSGCVAVAIPSFVPGDTEPAVEADYEGSGRVAVTASNPSGGGQGVSVVLVC